MELMVSPPLHTNNGLTHDDVVKIVLESLREISKESSIVVGVVLYMCTEDTGNFRDISGCSVLASESAQEIAELTVKYRNEGVCGFGIFGRDIPDVTVDSIFEWCPDTIRYLKDKQVSVCIAAGKQM
jgi:adenosine deaminase